MTHHNGRGVLGQLYIPVVKQPIGFVDVKLVMESLIKYLKVQIE
jgi:hypothetical protein